MQIASYLKTSLIEWPDKIASVVFTPGCNFRCPFCHNADLVKNHEIPLLKEEEILVDLKKRRKWIEAVVVTGGEPTLQKDLLKFLKSLKSFGLFTMIHTNGTRPEVITKLLDCSIVDYISMDLKGDFENYSNYSNCSNDQIIAVKESMKLIAGSGIEYEFRTTVVPGLHNLENLTNLAGEIKKVSQTGKTKWFLQQFQPKNTLDKKFLKLKPYSKEEMGIFRRVLQEIIPDVFLRGI